MEKSLSFLDSGKFADFTINCAGYIWEVHRVVIFKESDYFSKLCGGECKEASDRAVTLAEDDPRLIARLLVFLYAGHYPVYDSNERPQGRSLRKLLESGPVSFEILQPATLQPLSIHAALYGLGDKYGCTLLKHESRKRYIECLSRESSIPDFINSINIVYETTPEADKGLRKWAVWVSQGTQTCYSFTPASRTYFCQEEISVGILPLDMRESTDSGAIYAVQLFHQGTCVNVATTAFVEILTPARTTVWRILCALIAAQRNVFCHGPQHQLLTTRGSCSNVRLQMKR